MAAADASRLGEIALLGTLITIGFAFLACNQPFEPRAPLESKLVVFSILSTDRNDQVVRVERTYMPTGYDAMSYIIDGFVPGALVTIRESNNVHSLRDTTFARQDTSRYKFPLRAYVVSPLSIKYGGVYQVDVKSSQFEEASAAVLIPNKPVMTMTPLSSAVMQAPSSQEDSAEIVFTNTLGVGGKGWIGRLFVCFNVLKNGTWVEGRIEVPFYFINPRPFLSIRYGELTPSGFNNRSASVYLNIEYRATFIKVLYEMYPNTSVTFPRVVYELVQVDENLYNYFMVSHSGKDAFSVRVDEPLYTNLAGGVGILGAYTVDSLVQVLPRDFVFNR